MRIHLTHTAQSAIERSASHDEIVHVANHGTIQADLVAACDEFTNYPDDDGCMIYDYWGDDSSGLPWRVQVHNGSPH
jgi:hypothetical protein